MNTTTQEELSKKRCAPCEGGVPPLSREEAEALARERRGLGHSTLTARQISRSWTVKNFMAGIDFFNKVAALAEDEGHHPDLHLEGYRHVTIVLWTHAVGGLTENDFILAAKINRCRFRSDAERPQSVSLHIAAADSRQRSPAADARALLRVITRSRCRGWP